MQPYLAQRTNSIHSQRVMSGKCTQLWFSVDVWLCFMSCICVKLDIKCWCLAMFHKGHNNTIQVYSVTVITHVIALEDGLSILGHLSIVHRHSHHRRRGCLVIFVSYFSSPQTAEQERNRSTQRSRPSCTSSSSKFISNHSDIVIHIVIYSIIYYICSIFGATWGIHSRLCACFHRFNNSMYKITLRFTWNIMMVLYGSLEPPPLLLFC